MGRHKVIVEVNTINQAILRNMVLTVPQHLCRLTRHLNRSGSNHRNISTTSNLTSKEISISKEDLISTLIQLRRLKPLAHILARRIIATKTLLMAPPMALVHTHNTINIPNRKDFKGQSGATLPLDDSQTKSS